MHSEYSLFSWLYKMFKCLMWFTDRTPWFVRVFAFGRKYFIHHFVNQVIAFSILSPTLLLFPSFLFPHNQFLQGFFFAALAVGGYYLCSYFSQESNGTDTLRSLSSSSVLVVWRAGTPPPPPSPEEQAERASRQSAHAASHELHEAQPLAWVSVRTAALFGLCVMCVCVRDGRVNTQTRPSGKALPLHMKPDVPYGSVARQTAGLTACSTVNTSKQYLSNASACSS